LVAKNKDGNDWIPSPINVSTLIASKIPDIERLYVLNASFNQVEEDDSRLQLPIEKELEQLTQATVDTIDKAFTRKEHELLEV
jgi:hypothetical protein